jgi:hypothetical protein
MGNVALQQRQAATQGGVLRAQEMQAAQGAYLGGAMGMRGQDTAATQQQQGMLLSAQGQAAQQGQFLTQQEAQQRALNQQALLGFYGMRNQNLQAQQQGMQNYEQNETNRWTGQAAMDQGSNAQAAGNVKYGITTAAQLASGAAGGAGAGK